MDKVLAALVADWNFSVANRIANNGTSVASLVKQTGLSQSAVNSALRKLAKAGLASSVVLSCVNQGRKNSRQKIRVAFWRPTKAGRSQG